MDSPLLMPHSQIYASRKPVRLLDADGTVVCLPFQLNIPFCRMVARDNTLTRLKRWTIAFVYRTSTVGGVSSIPFAWTYTFHLLIATPLIATTRCSECCVRHRLRRRHARE